MFDNELITKSNERVVSFFKSIDRMLDGIEGLVRNCKPALGGERYLTDKSIGQAQAQPPNAPRLPQRGANPVLPSRRQNFI